MIQIKPSRFTLRFQPARARQTPIRRSVRIPEEAYQRQIVGTSSASWRISGLSARPAGPGCVGGRWHAIKPPGARREGRDDSLGGTADGAVEKSAKKRGAQFRVGKEGNTTTAIGDRIKRPGQVEVPKRPVG
jgi:hypothetical protein